MGSRKQAVIQLISTDGVYGAERVVLDLATYFARQSWDSRVVAIDCPGAGALLKLALARDLPTHELRAASRPIWSTLRDLRRYVLDEKIDVVHAHGYKADTLLRWAGIGSHVRKVSTCHTWYSDTLRMKFYEYLDKRSLRHFDHVAVVSMELKDELLACGVQENRISLIRNGTAVTLPAADTRQRIRLEFGLEEDAFLMVRVGRLASSKGNDILLKSLAKVLRAKPGKLLFVGDGEERAGLEQLAVQLGIASSVIFAGYRSDIPELLVASDLFVLPSIKEGLPIALLEAMAVGLPIVSTSAGAISIALEDKRNAWMIPAGDEALLAATLAEAMENPALRSRFGMAAQADFQKKFSADAMGNAYSTVYLPPPVSRERASAVLA